MNIDDIYTAAINSQTETLISLLEANEVDINELIDGGIHNGVHSRFPTLFSILVAMEEKGCYDYEILDILISYGANINEYVITETDVYTYRIPLVFYAIRWNDAKLVRYFMERGVRPHLAQQEDYTAGYQQKFPLAYVAMYADDDEILKTVLEYGAWPDDSAHVYNQSAAVDQILPVLFYALVDQQSEEKCTLLFRYGVEIDTCIYPTRRKPMKFNQYVSRYYPQLSDMLRRAYKAGRAQPLKPKNVYPEDFMHVRKGSVTPQKPAEKKADDSKMFVAEDEYALLRKVAIDLMALFLTKKGQYLEAVKDSKRNPGFFDRKGKMLKKSADELLVSLDNYRKKLIETLNQLDSSLTGGGKVRWWNNFDGFHFNPYFPSQLLLWMPFNRVTMGPDMLKLMPHCTATSTITGAELELLIKSGDVSPVYQKALEGDRVYNFAELCFWEIFDAIEIEKRTTKAYTEGEISSALEERSRRMDNFESLLNTVTGEGNFTSEEMFSFGKMQSSDYFESRNARNNLLREQEKRMRNAETTETVLKNKLFYEHRYSPVGVIAFNEDGMAEAILVYKEPRQTEVYTVTSENDIYASNVDSAFRDEETNRTYVLRSLNAFPIDAPDLIAEKPEYLTENEWVDFLYRCVVIQESSYLKDLINQRYQIAFENKQKKIRYTPFL